MPVPLQEVITIILPARPTSNPNGIVINEYHASSSLNYHNIIYIYIYIYIKRSPSNDVNVGVYVMKKMIT